MHAIYTNHNPQINGWVTIGGPRKKPSLTEKLLWRIIMYEDSSFFKSGYP